LGCRLQTDVLSQGALHSRLHCPIAGPTDAIRSSSNFSGPLIFDLWATMKERRPQRRRSPGHQGETSMGDFRDIHRDGNDPLSQHGVNDPVGGTDVKRASRDNASMHEREQWAADVRADSSADESEEFLPEALRRSPTSPLNKRTGRNPTN
jgi:hypothetical protein